MIRSLVVAAALLSAASSTIALAATAGAAPAAGSAARVRPAAAPTLAWHPCDVHFRCSELTVPIEYNHPSAGDLQLAVIELPSTAAHAVGDLVLNPGGPGASGVTFLEQNGVAFAALRAAFNLVSFDPRGIGASDPVSCGSSAELESFIAEDPVPTTAQQIATAILDAKTFVADCESETKRSLLDNVGTDATVNDIDRLRIALGDAKVNYLGFSYGTYLGERYAQRYPTHIRSMVLDGAVDPALGIKTTDEQQAEAFERDLDAFFSWCAGDHSCASGLPGGPRAAYATLMARLQRGTLITADTGPGNANLPAVNPALAQLGVISSLYTPTSWPFLGTALSEALRGNGSDLSVLAIGYEGIGGAGGTSNIIAANVAISCEDGGALGAVGDYVAFAKQVAPLAPDFGASNAWSTFVCHYWPVGASEQPQPIHAAGAPAILVVGSTGDPATPYAWAKSVASELAHGVLLTRNGYGHTGYFASSCIADDVNRYLIDLVLPPKGTVCPSN